ncbi:MAG: hypothetical protein JXA91_05050 [Candidatus Thermoplasmatota archaeon]|nr:hypothetical protein [Candidatus Thermoplasmatota archaeon]
MKNKGKKILGMVLVVLIVGTIGATTVSAMDVSGWGNKPSFKDLKNKWLEIQDAKQEIRDMAEGYGIDLLSLTGEQKREIAQTIHDLKKEGANRDEIKDAIIDLLIDFGVNIPDLTPDQRAEIRTKIKTHLQDSYGFIFIELTVEQKAYIKQTIIELKKQKATREEIKTAVVNLYESYGGIIPRLTDAEKKDIHEWIVTMLETDYGLDLPNLTRYQREALKNKKDEIRELQKELKEMLKDAGFFTKYRFLRYLRRHITSIYLGN